CAAKATRKPRGSMPRPTAGIRRSTPSTAAWRPTARPSTATRPSSSTRTIPSCSTCTTTDDRPVVGPVPGGGARGPVAVRHAGRLASRRRGASRHAQRPPAGGGGDGRGGGTGGAAAGALVEPTHGRLPRRGRLHGGFAPPKPG